MSTDSRAIAACTGLTAVLIGIVVVVGRLAPHAGVGELPSVPTASATAPAIPPLPQPASPAAQSSAPRLLLQRPSLSATEIAFDYAGEIWIVARAGGEA